MYGEIAVFFIGWAGPVLLLFLIGTIRVRGGTFNIGGSVVLLAMMFGAGLAMLARYKGFV